MSRQLFNCSFLASAAYTRSVSIIEAILLGLVQGLTEFIPVSSSGHLLLAQEVLGNGNNLVFDVFLHVGTLVAILVYFHKDIVELAKNLFAKNQQGILARTIAMATVPAVIIGLLFSDFIDDNLRTPLVTAITLIAVALVMLVADKKPAPPKETATVPRKKGLIIGLVQSAALIPGVSRSGATITTGVLLGLTRTQAARFSFLLAIPLVAGSAVGLMLRDSSGLSVGGWQIALGLIASFVSGIAAIKFLLGVISRAGLKPFAYYRIILAVIVLIFLV